MKRGEGLRSTLVYMVCAKCLLYIDECGFLSDWRFGITVFSCLSYAGISPAGLSEISALGGYFHSNTRTNLYNIYTDFNQNPKIG